MLSGFIGDDNAELISWVFDSYSNSYIGSLVVYHDNVISIIDGKTYKREISPKQKQLGITGAFLFVGTNADLFHHLFNSKFTGKIIGKEGRVLIDKGFSEAISLEFIQILQSYLCIKI